ncbi:MAG: hypothetical protein WDO56_05060 [Gammaproteobacteria bacterium]
MSNFIVVPVGFSISVVERGILPERRHLRLRSGANEAGRDLADPVLSDCLDELARLAIGQRLADGAVGIREAFAYLVRDCIRDRHPAQIEDDDIALLSS